MNNNINDLTFNTVREVYKNLRMLELYKIKEYLEDSPNINVTETKIYQGKFGCDNWLGLDVVINDERAFFISLQSFGKNENNKNKYVVMDKIGIYKYPKDILENHLKNGEKLETLDALDKMTLTDIELPMNENNLKQLVEKLK